MDQEQSEQYLKILSIFHYVVGGIAGLVACFPIIHFIVGLTMFVSSFIPAFLPMSEGSSFFPFLPFSLVGLIFTLVAGGLILLGWAFAVCLIIAGRSLATRQRYMFCLVMAGIACTFMPFGTVLGVLTIVLLVQPQVREMFDANQPALDDDQTED